MAFENFLRSIPLVHKHIMRTRRFMHENTKFKNFFERNGLQPSDILSDKATDLNLVTRVSGESNSQEMDKTLQMLADSLRAEQNRAAKLEADLYVLQIDYDALIKQKVE